MSRRNVAIAVLVLAVLGVALWFWRRGEQATRSGGDAGERRQARVQASSEMPAAASALAPIVFDAAPALAPSTGALATFSWGTGRGQMGRKRPEEANPEAPMSLAAASNGDVIVLDQVNERLVRVGADGGVGADVQLPVRAAQDVAVASDGTTAVLDRLGDKTIALLGPDGRRIGNIPLEGKGIQEGGAVTGVFVDGKDVYVEREHGTLVLVGDISGQASTERPEIPGRPSRDGKLLLSAGITDPPAGRVYVNAIERAGMKHRFTRELRMGAVVSTIMLLDTDRAGTIYFAVEVELTHASSAVILTCLDPSDGRTLGSVQLPANTLAEETFRPLTVLDEGGVVYARQTEEGMRLERYSCR